MPDAPRTDSISTTPAPERTATGSIRIPSATGAIRTLGSNPATAPIMLHPGDSISNGRRALYICLLYTS